MENKENSSLLGYKGIKAWQRSMDLVTYVYQFTKSFPDTERFGLTSQAQRAAVSVPANISEGYGRGGQAEFARFLDIAYGSLCELETLLLLADRLGYGTSEELGNLNEKASEVGRLLAGLRRSIRGKN
jgi:four helix bundle protein